MSFTAAVYNIKLLSFHSSGIIVNVNM